MEIERHKAGCGIFPFYANKALQAASQPHERSFLVGAIFLAYCIPALGAGTPVPTYGTYFGGGGDQSATSVVTDAAGNVILVGVTTSPSLPGTANSFQPNHSTGFANNTDVFIAKFDPTGQTLQWATFLGGNSDDVPTAVAVDPSGNTYVAGTTQSSNFPASTLFYCTDSGDFTTPFQQVCSSQPAQNVTTGGFLSKISSDGRSLLYSVGFGGSLLYGPGDFGSMVPTALTTDSRGEAYVATLGPGGSNGMFLFRLNSAGNALSYGAFIGGGGLGFAGISSLTVDSNGNCYAVGISQLTVPTTSNALQASNPNANLTPNLGGGFLVEVNAAGTQVLYGTWFGSEFYATSITSVALAPDGSLYFAGFTNATAFQATPGSYSTSPSTGFVAKLTPGRPSLDSFSYLPEIPSGQNSANMTVPTNAWTQIALNSQTQVAYLTFGVPGSTFFSNTSGGLVELTMPTLGHVSSFVTSSVSASGFSLSGGSAWLAGSCSMTTAFPCSGTLQGEISANAYQPQPSGTSDAVLIDLTNISTSISFVGSAASGTSPFAAGELISVYGSQLGPAVGVSAQIGSNLMVGSSVGGTTVLFNGIPAPILYSRADLVNTAIPCELAGQTSAQLVVEYLGVQSPPMTIPLSPAAPAIFTANSSGTGQGLVFNADYSENSATNPAARGSAVFFYATGLGAMSPACVDGLVYTTSFPTATLPVIAGVGNLGAQVLYAGQAPDLMAGVAQVNVVIPDDSPTGSVPLALLVNGVFSPPGVTIAVK